MTAWTRFLLTSGVAACLAGCQATGTACDGWRPIRGTPADAAVVSDRLAASILSHNEQGRRVCGWRP